MLRLSSCLPKTCLVYKGGVHTSLLPSWVPSMSLRLVGMCMCLPVCSVHFNSSSQSLGSCTCAQSSPTQCDPMNCSLPSSPVHGILQARILECISPKHCMGCIYTKNHSFYEIQISMVHVLIFAKPSSTISQNLIPNYTTNSRDFSFSQKSRG